MASKKKDNCICCSIGITLQHETKNLLDNWKLCKKHEEEATAILKHREEVEVKPPKKEFIQEDILVDEFVNGEIKEVEYDMAHEFKGQFARTAPAVKLTIALDGYQQTKSSGWLTFSLNEKARLYKVYVKPLFPNVKPDDSGFDVDQLKGKRAKFMFGRTEKDGNTYYNVEMVKPIAGAPLPKNAPTTLEPEDESTPF